MGHYFENTWQPRRLFSFTSSMESEYTEDDDVGWGDLARVLCASPAPKKELAIEDALDSSPSSLRPRPLRIIKQSPQQTPKSRLFSPQNFFVSLRPKSFSMQNCTTRAVLEHPAFLPGGQREPRRPATSGQVESRTSAGKLCQTPANALFVRKTRGRCLFTLFLVSVLSKLPFPPKLYSNFSRHEYRSLPRGW